MQKIDGIPADYTLTRWFLPIYEAYSVRQFPRSLDVPPAVRAVLNIVHNTARVSPLQGDDGQLPKLQVERPTQGRKKAFISFAGGKDALAVALRARLDGYDVTLMYIQGVNKVVPSEGKAAEAVAREAGFPLVRLKLNIKGQKDFGEHPLKNVFILCLLIDEGIKHGATAFGQGNVFEEDSEHSIIDDCLSDSYDMLHLWARFMRQLIPGFTHLQYLHDNLQAFYTVFRYAPATIPLLSTCNVGDFRRPMRRKYIAEHYGADVLPAGGGCGGCYKCAMEFNNLVRFGLKRPNAKYQRFGAGLIATFKQSHRKKGAPAAMLYRPTGGVQVLRDVIGYYIGRMVQDERSGEWYVWDFFGHHHYAEREQAETICSRFKSLYKLA